METAASANVPIQPCEVFSRATIDYRLLLVANRRTREREAAGVYHGFRKWAGNYQSVKGTAVEHDCAIRKPVSYAYTSGGLVKNSIDRPPLWPNSRTAE